MIHLTLKLRTDLVIDILITDTLIIDTSAIHTKSVITNVAISLKLNTFSFHN
ncbi:hypothetical protein HMPREF9373_0588 [Psychrobacter sp. 1501(2011)]|nr:hypothetical protein HMPREF9373_0588 [Psychrobacter sp. 1501(2011)]